MLSMSLSREIEIIPTLEKAVVSAARSWNRAIDGPTALNSQKEEVSTNPVYRESFYPDGTVKVQGYRDINAYLDETVQDELQRHGQKEEKPKRPNGILRKAAVLVFSAIR